MGTDKVMEAVFQVQVKSMIGGDINLLLEVTRGETIKSLKKKVAVQTKRKWVALDFCCNNQILEDAKSVEEYHIHDSPIIHVLPKIPKRTCHLLYDTSPSMNAATKQAVLDSVKTTYNDSKKIWNYCGCDFANACDYSMTGTLVAISKEAAWNDHIYVVADFQDDVHDQVDQVLIPKLTKKDIKLCLYTVEGAIHPALERVVKATEGEIRKF